MTSVLKWFGTPPCKQVAGKEDKATEGFRRLYLNEVNYVGSLHQGGEHGTNHLKAVFIHFAAPILCTLSHLMERESQRVNGT